MIAPERCESCARWEVAKLIYFNDLGPVFAVCHGCSDSASGLGATVLELDADGQVMVAVPDDAA